VKKYLEMKNVEFTVKQGDVDDAEYMAHANKFGGSVPLVVNTETMQGTTGNNYGKIKQIVGV